jgi:hypothetical protein
MKRHSSSIAVAIVLALLTATSYLAWLGWDQQKDVDAAGNASGPYESWQVLGLAVTVGLLAGGAGWVGRSWSASAVIPTVLTVCFAIDAMTDPDADGLWAVGAVLVAIGSLTAITIVAQVAHAVHAQVNPRRPDGGAAQAGVAPAP